MPPADALRAALGYARQGWPVFPCRPGAKEPATRHGFKDASTDQDRVLAWWRAHPDANVAIATGAPGPDVLDVDVHRGGTGYAAYNTLRRAGLISRDCGLVRTPSGGFHAYFTGTDQPSGRIPGEHLDFKAAGGYVVAPPSRVGGRFYVSVRQQVGDTFLDWAAARALLDPPSLRREAHATTQADVRRLAGWVARLEEGNRNAGLYWAACRAIESGHGDELGQLASAAAATGLPDLEIRRTIASAWRGMTRSDHCQLEAEEER